VGRAINRHDFSRSVVATSLERPVVRRILELIKLRATHPAFQGRLDVVSPAPTVLRLTWTLGPVACRLVVDLASGRCEVDELDGT
jgi:sucrose phosphorylase